MSFGRFGHVVLTRQSHVPSAALVHRSTGGGVVAGNDVVPRLDLRSHYAGNVDISCVLRLVALYRVWFAIANPQTVRDVVSVFLDDAWHCPNPNFTRAPASLPLARAAHLGHDLHPTLHFWRRKALGKYLRGAGRSLRLPLHSLHAGEFDGPGTESPFRHAPESPPVAFSGCGRNAAKILNSGAAECWCWPKNQTCLLFAGAHVFNDRLSALVEQ